VFLNNAAAGGESQQPVFPRIPVGQLPGLEQQAVQRIEPELTGVPVGGMDTRLR